jgi:diguanylate cyclase (GGDEF)-like protein
LVTDPSSVLRVLVVDDSRPDRVLIRNALVRAATGSYEIMECDNAAEAQALVLQHRPDAIILDYRLPGEDGVSCLERLASQIEGVAFLIMTGQGDERTAVRAMKAGAADYLLKDQVLRDPARIEHAVRSAIHTQRLERENARLLETLRERNLELERLNQKLWRLSHTDELTGFFNRRYITARLEEEISRCARYSTSLSVVFIDLDHFKQINDQFNHQGGDQALQAVADFFRRNLRDTDLVGRFGGEEFLLILTNTDAVGAELFCNRLRDRLQAQSIQIADSVIYLTASFGVAGFGPDRDTTEKLIRAADLNLFRAKAQGRNCVVLA